jgi:FlaA1/EpsC-like NDP-sugar epimerase
MVTGVGNKFASVIRKPKPLSIEQALDSLRSERIFITGGKGSLGSLLQIHLASRGILYESVDVDDGDVTNLALISQKIHHFNPTVLVHLAADKHAPKGELDPKSTLEINAVGTKNILNSMMKLPKVSNCRMILASTCKACDPETVYGATKLIAERMTLQSGNYVARFHNVIETQGNVFDIWESLPSQAPLPVTPCRRYFIFLDEAISLLIRTLEISKHVSPSRYIFNPGPPLEMIELARKLYPQRELQMIEPRRGDRLREPLIATSETKSILEENLWKIESPHDL